MGAAPPHDASPRRRPRKKAPGAAGRTSAGIHRHSRGPRRDVRPPSRGTSGCACRAVAARMDCKCGSAVVHDLSGAVRSLLGDRDRPSGTWSGHPQRRGIHARRLRRRCGRGGPAPDPRPAGDSGGLLDGWADHAAALSTAPGPRRRHRPRGHRARVADSVRGSPPLALPRLPRAPVEVSSDAQLDRAVPTRGGPHESRARGPRAVDARRDASHRHTGSRRGRARSS